MKKKVVFLLGLYVVCLVSIGWLWDRPVALTFLFGLISLMMLFLWHTKRDFVFYFVGFSLGPIGEWVAIYFGAYRYSKPFYLIPIWLPLLWGIAMLFMEQLSKTLLQGRRSEN